MTDPLYHAAQKDQKIAMFHFHVLKNADELVGANPIGFCKKASVPLDDCAKTPPVLVARRFMENPLGAKRGAETGF